MNGNKQDNDTQTELSTLGTLPAEMLTEVFSNLAIEDLRSVRCCSKRMKNVTDNYQRYIFMKKIKDNASDYKKYIKQYPYVLKNLYAEFKELTKDMCSKIVLISSCYINPEENYLSYKNLLGYWILDFDIILKSVTNKQHILSEDTSDHQKDKIRLAEILRCCKSNINHKKRSYVNSLYSSLPRSKKGFLKNFYRKNMRE